MNIEEFIDACREHLRGGWRVMRVGALRRSVEGAGVWECPVCALDYALHNQGSRKRLEFPVQNFVESGNRLGLTAKRAERIAIAADERGYDPALRTRLLDALGVEPEQTEQGASHG